MEYTYQQLEEFVLWGQRVAKDKLRESYGDNFLNAIKPLGLEDNVPKCSMTLVDLALRWRIELSLLKEWVSAGKIPVLPGWVVRSLVPEDHNTKGSPLIIPLGLFVSLTDITRLESAHAFLSKNVEQHIGELSKDISSLCIPNKCLRPSRSVLSRHGLELNKSKTYHAPKAPKTEPTELSAQSISYIEQATTRTEAASQARQEKTLKAWKPAIGAMIKVAVRCGEEGRALRQQPDFNAMFNELDAILNNAQMNLFRKSLPDEHIDRTGGPRGKVTPS